MPRTSTDGNVKFPQEVLGGEFRDSPAGDGGVPEVLGVSTGMGLTTVIGTLPPAAHIQMP